MRPINSLTPKRPLLALLLLCAAALAASAVQASDEPGYGWYRTVEGEVRLTTLERSEPLDVEPNYPLLLGDRVWVGPTGRLEAILPDHTVLRAGGGTDLYFEDLSLYADETAGAGTVLRLLEGEIQIVVTGYQREREPVRVETPNATIYLQEAGTYRIYADELAWTEVVVREGFGEVLLADGSVVVRANEEAVIDGEVDPRVRVYPAGAYDALEAWGDDLDREAEIAANDHYVDESLRYEAAPLYEHGRWLPVGSSYAWQPHVAPGWRPFTRGYWTHTPAGLYWVSSEPWGGLTAHYGSWGLHASYGWVWYPGRVFSPAWVTWYWGTSYVGWVPSGYYSHYYGPRGYLSFGLRFGSYGWAGGSWSSYSNWTFCPTRYFGWRSYRSEWYSGAELGRRSPHREVPRGLITGTTRGIERGRYGRLEEVAQAIERNAAAGIHGGATRSIAGNGARLPDVTDFVARKPTLRQEVRQAVFADADAPRSPVRRPAVRSIPVASVSAPGTRIRSSAPPMPIRPDVSRRELVDRQPLRREPVASAPRSIESRPTVRMRTEPVAPAPRSIPASPSVERPVRERVTAPVVPAPERREPIRMPPEAQRPPERAPAPQGYVYGRPSTPTAPSPPAAQERPEAPTARMPIVRRVLEGIRGSQPSRPAPPSAPSTSRSPSTSVRKPSSPSTPPRVSRPSSQPSSRPSARPGSRPSSGSTTKPLKPKSKPPRD